MNNDEQDGEAPKLGDILATGSDWHNRPRAPLPRANADPWFNRPYDNFICQVARQHGEDPEEVLREFHSGSPLARTLRKVLNLDDIPAKVRVYYMRRSWDRKAMSRAAHDAAIAAYLNSGTDAAGRKLHNITPESVRKMGEEGARMLLAEATARIESGRTLADFFAADPGEPKP